MSVQGLEKQRTRGERTHLLGFSFLPILSVLIFLFGDTLLLSNHLIFIFTYKCTNYDKVSWQF